MPSPLTPEQIESLMAPYLSQPLPAPALLQFAQYLELLLRWNALTNLTSLRLPEQIVQTHFGESVFAAQHLPSGLSTLLDFGSGAGFPGLPIQICQPGLTVPGQPGLQITLAESQGKKAAFLREAVRTLQLPTTVFHGRAQDMPPHTLFSAVTLRAVDDMAQAVPAALRRLAPGGWLVLLTSLAQVAAIHAAANQQGSTPNWHPPLPLPNSDQRILLLAQQP